MAEFDAAAAADPAADPFGDDARAVFDRDRQALAAAKLDAFRERALATRDLTRAQRRFLSDDTLLRYLRARDGDEAAALTMLVTTLEWRAANIDPLAASDTRCFLRACPVGMWRGVGHIRACRGGPPRHALM